MSNCPGCDNSSTTYSRCNPPVSTNCVFYQGESKVCSSDNTFTICKGGNLSDIQLTIFNKICELSGSIDVNSIQFPCSLQDAWEDEDPTILNLLQYVVNVQCEQKGLLESIQEEIATINPQVEVCLSCCEPGCQTSAKLLLSEALQKIIQCICDTKAIADQALQKANDAIAIAQVTETAYAELVKKQCEQNIKLTNIITYLNKPVDEGGLNAGLTFDLTPCQ